MRAALAAKQEPIFSGYEKLRSHPFSDPAQLTREPAAEIGRNPSVKEVAEAVHVSPSHLRRLFAEVRSASPKELFRRARLEKAQDLLGRTSLTLDEIARHCGYASASHFCREYKTVHHFTPSTWRRRLIDRFTRPLPPGVVPVREFSARPGERSLRA